jgi:hypothetical protein
VRDLARQHSVKAINRIAEMLDSENGKEVIAAAIALLDRAWGKPKEHVELSGPEGGEIQIDLSGLSDEELKQMGRLIRKAKGESE